MIDFSDLAASRSLAVAETVGRLALRSGSALRPFSAHPRRWAAVAAFIAISGCSSFGGDEVQEPASGKAATATASGTSPDINSVPTSVPQPQDVSIDGVQSGVFTPPVTAFADPSALISAKLRNGFFRKSSIRALNVRVSTLPGARLDRPLHTTVVAVTEVAAIEPEPASYDMPSGRRSVISKAWEATPPSFLTMML